MHTPLLPRMLKLDIQCICCLSNFVWYGLGFVLFSPTGQIQQLAQAVGGPVGWHSGDRLAMMLVATKTFLFYFPRFFHLFFSKLKVKIFMEVFDFNDLPLFMVTGLYV